MSTDELLRAGIAAAKANDSVGASNLLSQVVKTDPKSELGWLWLGYCRTIPQQREYCFRQVLLINPENVEAKRQIEILNHPVASLGDLNPSVPQSEAYHVASSRVVESPKTRAIPPEEQNTNTPRQAKKTTPKKARRNDNRTFIWVGIGIIILLCIAVVGLVLSARIMNLTNFL